MFRVLGCFCLFLLCGSSLAVKKCSHVGIFPSTDLTKFIVCREKDGDLIGAEFTCSNATIYSGLNAKCVPRSNGIIKNYNLLTVAENDASDTEVKLQCISPGIICSACDTMTFCVGVIAPDGTSTVKVLEDIKCIDGEHCAMDVGCTKDAQKPCSLAPFVCDDSGVFPDPYDCTKYHFCSEGGVTDYTCSTGSFDSQTAACGYNMTSPACLQRPVPFCKTLYQVGPLPTDASYFYICVKYKDDALRPSLHRCPANQKFSITTFSCS